MVRLTNQTTEATLSNEAITILSEALLHEMERHNQAADLVTNQDARKAIENAKHKVYEVFKAVNQFLQDPTL